MQPSAPSDLRCSVRATLCWSCIRSSPDILREARQDALVRCAAPQQTMRYDVMRCATVEMRQMRQRCGATVTRCDALRCLLHCSYIFNLCCDTLPAPCFYVTKRRCDALPTNLAPMSSKCGTLRSLLPPCSVIKMRCDVLPATFPLCQQDAM